MAGTVSINLCRSVLESGLVSSGGYPGGSNKISSRGGNNNISNKIVTKVAGTASIDLCSPVLETDLAAPFNPLFPRALPRFKHLSSFTRIVDIAQNEMIEGCLADNKSTPLPVIGIIVKERCDWVPALAFIPLSSLWVWVLDSRWKSICKCSFPDFVMIDGSLDPLPTVNFLFLSRVSLNRYGINLYSVPFSLLLTSTGNLSNHSD